MPEQRGKLLFLQTSMLLVPLLGLAGCVCSEVKEEVGRLAPAFNAYRLSVVPNVWRYQAQLRADGVPEEEVLRRTAEWANQVEETGRAIDEALRALERVR